MKDLSLLLANPPAPLHQATRPVLIAQVDIQISQVLAGALIRRLAPYAAATTRRGSAVPITPESCVLVEPRRARAHPPRLRVRVRRPQARFPLVIPATRGAVPSQSEVSKRRRASVLDRSAPRSGPTCPSRARLHPSSARTFLRFPARSRPRSEVHRVRSVLGKCDRSVSTRRRMKPNQFELRASRLQSSQPRPGGHRRSSSMCSRCAQGSKAV